MACGLCDQDHGRPETIMLHGEPVTVTDCPYLPSSGLLIDARSCR
jgi:hypothetical protein